MDRPIVYPGQIARALDFLNTNRNTMTALAAAMQAVLGTTTEIDGLACTPTSPASMQVTVGPGSIYSLANLDATDYSSLLADTTHSILKQGIRLDASNFNCPAPAVSGQSVVYLIQAAFTETDGTPVTLPYYNSSNPATPYSGPGNSGTAQNTVRKGVCTVSIKTGVAATTGTQTTPAADAGYTGLYAITVANGATSITSGNIAVVPGAPFITEKLKDKISQTTADARYLKNNYKQDSGSANAYIIALSPAITSYTDGLIVEFKAAHTNTGASTLDAGGGAVALKRHDGSALVAGDIIANGIYSAILDSASGFFYLLNSTQQATPAFSNASNGYIKFANGLIVQWGGFSATTAGGTVNYPVAFASQVFVVIGQTSTIGQTLAVTSNNAASFSQIASANMSGCGFIAIGV